jgi:hypothetical protein
MPEIIVAVGAGEEPRGAVLLRERISPADLESDHFAAQLLERLAWAVGDAQAAEQASRSECEAATHAAVR